MDFLKQAVNQYTSGDNQNQNQNQNNQYNNQNTPGSYGNDGNQGGGFGGQQNFGGQGQGEQGGAAAGFFNNTGGPQYNAPHGQGGATSGGFMGFGGVGNVDQSTAMAAATANASQQDSSLFSSAFGFLSNMGKDDDNDIDEEKVLRKHDQAYNQGNAGGMSANSMGTAAALQAFKMFTSGQEGPAQQQGGNMQSKVIGMAMSEAAKLFDNSGGAANGNKQDAVNSAGMMIMKLLIKSQFSGTTGGGNSGGLGSMLSMASKFMQ